MIEELTCEVCGKTYKGEAPDQCCNGGECGCMGRPVDPMVCSEDCYNVLMQEALRPIDMPIPNVHRPI